MVLIYLKQQPHNNNPVDFSHLRPHRLLFYFHVDFQNKQIMSQQQNNNVTIFCFTLPLSTICLICLINLTPFFPPLQEQPCQSEAVQTLCSPDQSYCETTDSLSVSSFRYTHQDKLVLSYTQYDPLQALNIGVKSQNRI